MEICLDVSAFERFSENEEIKIFFWITMKWKKQHFENKFYDGLESGNVAHIQCDQIGRFIGLWVTFKAFGNN